MPEPQSAVTGSDVPASTASSEATTEKASASTSSRMGGFIRSVLGMGPSQPASDRSANEEPKTAENSASDGADAAQSDPAETASTGETDPDKPITLTQKELDERVRRAAQSEADRREAKRRRDEQIAQAQRAAEERKNKRRQVRQEDPYQFARLDEQEETEEEQAAATGKLVETVTTRYDNVMVKPLWDALDEATQEEIRKHLPQDDAYEARAYLAKKAIEGIQRAAEAKAKESLRKSSSFRKELLAELRGQDDSDEPRHIEGSGPPGSRPEIGDVLRAMAGY